MEVLKRHRRQGSPLPSEPRAPSPHGTGLLTSSPRAEQKHYSFSTIIHSTQHLVKLFSFIYLIKTDNLKCNLKILGELTTRPRLCRSKEKRSPKANIDVPYVNGWWVGRPAVDKTTRLSVVHLFRPSQNAIASLKSRNHRRWSSNRRELVTQSGICRLRRFEFFHGKSTYTPYFHILGQITKLIDRIKKLHKIREAQPINAKCLVSNLVHVVYVYRISAQSV
jgi:hypothetical protein